MAKKINQITSMPQMRVAFSGWKTQITMTRLTRNIDATTGFDASTSETFVFKGTVQPLSDETLELKPDAQRGFEWLQVHVELNTSDTIAVNLNIGDIILYNDRRYRVNGKKDYSLNNYIEYHIMEVSQ